MEKNVNLNTNVKIASTSSLKDILRNTIRNNIRQYTMVIALLGIWIIFQFLTKGIFISPRNLSNLFLQSASIAILACGMVLVLVAGHIDLSVGSVVGFTGAICAVLMTKHHFGTIPTILIALGVGILIGIWQGFWVAYRQVPAFIVTLAGLLMYRGGVLGVTGGKTVSPMNDSFKAIGQGYLPKLTNLPFHDTTALIGLIFMIAYVIFEINKRKSRIKYGFEVLPMNLQIAKIIGGLIVIGLVMSIMITYMGIPYAVLLLMAIIIIFTVIAEKTTFGRYVYAIGGNKEAARLSGINIRRVNMLVFILMSVLATVAGIVYTARLNAATGSAGANMELDAIASAVIGGTSTLGGEGTIVGCIIGALVMASLDNGMSLMNLGVTWQYIVKGLILLLAVWVDIATRKTAT
ncbi:MAG: sugar ABC transporter permease [Clostridiaceae bacterium]|nr:sugar ABC transporter permease [Clostridiaceae bacterium]